MPGCLDIWYLGGFMWFCLDLCGFRWISWIPGVEGLSTCGGIKSGAATPLTNLYSDAGVGRYMYLGGFKWFSWIPGPEGFPALRVGLLPL